jgi:hypothetical protein
MYAFDTRQIENVEISERSPRRAAKIRSRANAKLGRFRHKQLALQLKHATFCAVELNC